MTTKTFLGNAVLQNFTLANFRMQRGRVWLDAATDTSSEAPAFISKDALTDPDKLVRDAVFQKSLDEYMKSKNISDPDHPLSKLKVLKDDAIMDPEARLVLASLTRSLDLTRKNSGKRNTDQEHERAAKALTKKLPEAFAELSREYERDQAVEKAGKDTQEFKIKFERQVDKARNQMDEPWYGIPAETRANVQDLCQRAGIRSDALWYAIVDDYKLDEKELSAMSGVDRKKLSENGAIKALVAQIKELRGYIEHVGRPKDSQWDLYPNWKDGRLESYGLPNAIAPSGAGMFFDIKVDPTSLCITQVRLSKTARLINVDSTSSGSVRDKIISLTVQGKEYKLTSRNGHKPVAELADDDTDFANVKVGKTLLPLNEASDEYTNAGNIKVAFSDTLERQLKGYDVKFVLPLVLKYAELKKGGGLDAELLEVARGQKKTGKFLGLFGGKSQDVVVFDEETFTKLNSSFAEFKAWLDAGKVPQEGGKKEKKERARVSGAKVYQEFYDRKESSNQAKRAYALMAVLDSDNSGIFNQIAEAKGKTVEDLAQGKALFTKINQEGNAPVDLQLWMTLGAKDANKANEMFRRVLELGAVDSVPPVEYSKVDLTTIKPNEVTDAMRQAYARGRERAAAMMGNLGEYVQGELGGNLEKKRQDATGMTNRIMSQLEANRDSLKISDQEWNELRNGVMKFQLAFYLHWTDWRHYLNGKLIKHTKGIDGFGAGGRYRFELTKNVAIVMDAGVGRALLAGDLLSVANLGLEYSVQIKDASFRVSAGTGAVSAEASTRVGKDKTKELGVNFYQSYFGTLTAVIGTFTWSNLNKELTKKVENSPYGRDLIAMVDEAKGYDTLEKAANGIRNPAEGTLKAKILGVLGKEIPSDDANRDQKLAIMYLTFITEMIAQYKREAALGMAENRSLKSKFKPVGVQGGLAMLGGIPVPVFGLIMRHSIEAVQPVKPATLEALADLQRSMDLRVAASQDAFGAESQEKTGVEGETFESEMQGDMKRLTYVINEKGERVPVKVEGQGKIEFTDFKKTKGDVPGMLPDPYLDGALSKEAKASLSAQGVDITGVQEGRGRSLLVALPGLPEYRSQKDFTMTYRVHVGEGVSVTSGFTDKMIAVGGDLHSITAYTRLEGNQAHVVTDVYLASSPYEATLRSEHPGRTITLEVSNYGTMRTMGAWPEGLRGQQWKDLDAPTRVKENEEKSRAMQDYVVSSNALMEDLRNAGSVEAGEKNDEHRASIDKLASALAINLGPRNPKRKEVEQACFDLLVGSSTVPKKDQIDTIATLVGEGDCVAAWDAMSNVDRVYLINRIADAYFKDKPDAARKDLAAAINKRVEQEFKKGDSHKKVAIEQLTSRLETRAEGIAPTVDRKALAEKIYNATYLIDRKGKSRFADIALSNGKYGTSGEYPAGYPIESLVAHKVGQDKFYGFSEFVTAGDRGLFGMKDLLGDGSPLTPDEKKVVEQAFRNGLNKVVSTTLDQFDTKDPEQVRAFLRTPMVQQLRPALGVALGEELGRGLLVLLDNPTNTHVGIHHESVSKAKEIVTQLATKKEAKVPVKVGDKDRELTIKAVGAKAMVGAYEDCLNFSMGFVEEYEMSMKLDYTETWKLNAPEGVGMVGGFTTNEYQMLEPVLKENRWSIIGGVLKCYMKSSATGPTTTVTPGPGKPGVGLGPRP